MLHSPQVAAAAELLGLHMGNRQDKVGAPMILHSLRVASIAAARGLDDHHIAAALLHDLVEDTDCTIEHLVAAGLDPEIIDTVEVLTHGEREPYRAYIARVAAYPMAARVKLCDIADNMTPDRIAVVRRPEKYTEALRILAAAGHTP